MPYRKPGEYLIPIIIEPLEEGGFLATSHFLRGLVAQGRTVAETMEIAQDVARKLVESYLDHGYPLPKGLLRVDARRAKAHAHVPICVGR